MKEVKSMSQIDYEQDRVQSVTQADAAESLSSKVIELKNLEDEIANLGDIIKNDVTVTFGRGEDNKASEYANLAKGQGYEPVQKIGVHAQTLKAVVRERLEAGREMPSDLFKTYAGNSTKITRRT